MNEIYNLNSSGMFSEEELQAIRECELKREYLLTNEEHLWRLKRRSIWINKGANNTKLFHRYVSHRRNVNTISEIKDASGNMVNSFKEKA